MKNTVIINYKQEPESSLDDLAGGVVSSLTENTNFTQMEALIERLKTALDKFRLYKEKCVDGGPSDTSLKNVAKDEVINALHDIGEEVNRQANGDLVKLKTSGLRLAKTPSTKGQLPKPTGFKVVSGPNSGELVCVTEAYAEATIYLFFIATVPAPASMTEWRQIVSTTRKNTITGLTPGTQYALRCAYKGSDPNLIYSDVITIYAQ
jgi:hypothetical protein